MQTITHPTTAEGIGHELRLLGFVEGAPPHIPAAFVLADVRIYSRLRCAVCGHRGHKVTPMSRGREYRLLCSCQKCGAEVEA